MLTSNSSDASCVVVLDLGSSSIRAGFTGDSTPQWVVPNIRGRPSASTEPMIGADLKGEYLGEEALCSCSFLSLTPVLERGVVRDWNGLESQLTHIFRNLLRVSPEECDVLVTEPVLNPKSNREKLCQMFFESLQVERFCVETDSLLCMYSEGGRTTGVVMSSGDGVTSVLPVYDGYPIPGAVRRLDLAGSDVTDYLTTLLTERGYYFNTSAERQVVRDIKEQLARVSYNFNQDMADSWAVWRPDSEKVYTLPDCSVITVDSRLFECAECLFQPRTHLGRDHQGIHQLIHSSIKASPTDIRGDLYANILLSGGNTLLSGIGERIRKEMVDLSPPKARVKVVSPPQRENLAWKGGSVVASLSTFDNWVSISEYNDWGPSLVHKQCF